MFRPRRRHGASPRRRQPDRRGSGQWRLWLRRAGLVMACAAAGLGVDRGVRTLLDPAVFPLRQVHLEGEARNLSADDLRRLAAPWLGRNFFAADIAGLGAAFAANPWIEAVTVRRVWPDSVRVRFREREAFGYWGQDGELVDVHGRRFRPAKVLQATPLPRLAGPDGQERTLITIFMEAKALLATVDLEIDRLMMDERRAWWITLANGVEIRLGRAEFSRRLQRFVDVYPRALAPRMERIAAVDLRYGNGFAVRWAQPPATPRPPKATADGRRGTARGGLTRTRLTPTPDSAGRRPGRNVVYVETQ